MKKTKEIENLARELRNKQARDWRKNNKDKVKEINRKYWLKKAEKQLELEKSQEKGGEENEPRN